MYFVNGFFTDLRMLENHRVHFRGSLGSIEGPRLVLDPVGVSCFVSRVPRNAFLLLRMQRYS